MTKQKNNLLIFRAAIKLFSENGYNNTSMNQIAAQLEIDEAELTRIYPNKDELKLAIYDFFKQAQDKARPDFDAILESCKHRKPFDVLMSLDYDLPRDIIKLLTQIFQVATQNMLYDETSKDLIAFIMDYGYNCTKKLCDRMMELGKIEPINSDAFARLIPYYVFSTVTLDSTLLGAVLEERQAGMKALMSIPKAILDKNS